MIKALVVDDVFLNKLLIINILEELGHQAVGASNGTEAAQLLQKDKFDIVFIDIEMPGMNGFEVIEFMRNDLQNENSKIPAIATTAHYGDDALHKLMAKGFTDVLQKPYHKFKLIDILKKHCSL